jgi:hypothetical protein
MRRKKHSFLLALCVSRPLTGLLMLSGLLITGKQVELEEVEDLGEVH